MRDYLDLDTHILFPKPGHADYRPDWLMVTHPLFDIPHNGAQGLIVERNMIQSYRDTCDHPLPPASG